MLIMYGDTFLKQSVSGLRLCIHPLKKSLYKHVDLLFFKETNTKEK